MTPDDCRPTPPVAGRRAFILSGGAALLLTACSTDQTTSTKDAAESADAADSATDKFATTTSTLPATASSTNDSTAGDASPTSAIGSTGFSAADFDGFGTCHLLPEQTAGPFPLDKQFNRRDITEDVEGHALRLGFRVVDAACAPISAASVEIWHCDATGDYSAFVDDGGGKDDGPGTTFLRGAQTSDADGIVEFLTIVPGWYSGRAVHIHLRVHRDDDLVLTSQLYFDADELRPVYARAPYLANGNADTSNESDSIAGDPTDDGTLLMLTDGETSRGTGSVALLNLGVPT